MFGIGLIEWYGEVCIGVVRWCGMWKICDGFVVFVGSWMWLCERCCVFVYVIGLVNDLLMCEI